MITSDFTGNLGNHLFQYAITREIAERKGFNWGFTKYIYGDYYKGKSQMDFMDIDYGIQPVVNIVNEYNEKNISIGGHTNIQQFVDFNDLCDNTKLVGCWQTEQYFNKLKVYQWFKIKSSFITEFNNKLISNNISLDNNICVINIRGGEYKGLNTLLLPNSYWNNAINHMQNINSNINFIVVSDDINYAKSVFPNFRCMHFDIAGDYYLVNTAKYLILSNSSFAWFPAWLNTDVKYVIAPKYWARHNNSDGYWANGNIFTKGWLYLSKENKLETYEEIVKELKNSKYAEFYKGI
jgi:hypothetical protein